MESTAVLQLFTLFVLSVAMSAPVDDDDNGGRNWALLVAGSNTFNNYRHQADICHAYHIVSKHGIPDERIIVMMYDDIAYNRLNLYPGVIMNKPNGTNVYPGVPKDYTKKEVRPEVFLKVLTGDAEGVEKLIGRKGKVIKSGPKDRVFVNFADHGGYGLLAFPSDVLWSDVLHDTILKMYHNNQYKQILFYVEACESGSMFYNFTAMPHLNAFATTAANPNQPSYGCYFDHKLDTALGDTYSISWMEDSDQENLKRETIEKQFEIVHKRTKQSQTQKYGDMSFMTLPLADFLGSKKADSLYFTSEEPGPDPWLDAVPAEDVDQTVLLRKIARTEGSEKEKAIAELQELWQRKKDSEDFFRKVLGSVVDETRFEEFVQMPGKISDISCYKQSVQLMMDLCPGMNLPQNYYALRKLRVLNNMCEYGLPPQQIWNAVAAVALKANICA